MRSTILDDAHSARRTTRSSSADRNSRGRSQPELEPALGWRRHAWALLAAGVLIIMGCGAGEEPVPAATPVRIAKVESGPAAPAIRTNGVLANKDEFRLSFKVGGVIAHIAVREGERVRRGQQLAQIEQTEIDAQVEQARQAHEKAQRDVERGERLYADKVISLEQLESLRTQQKVAQAALRAAEFNRSYATILAPSNGTVLRRLAEERELIAAGAPVLIVGTQDRGYVVQASVADREVVQLELGDAARVELDALPGVELQGTISEIASGADPASGMFRVEIALEPTELPLRSGLVAKLAITPASAHASTLPYVPIASIVEGQGDRASVFVVEAGRAQRRDVQVAFIADERVALTSGIEPGASIVTDGALFLEDGERVTVQEAAAPSAERP